MVNTKKAIELLYKDRCSIIEYQEYTKPNKSTGHKEVVVLNDQPCKLSFSTLEVTNQTETAATLVQKATLFIAPEIVIKEGSKLIVSHKGRIYEYKNSGVAGVFSSHQQIILELFKGWA